MDDLDLELTIDPAVDTCYLNSLQSPFLINGYSSKLLCTKFKFKVYWQNQQKTCFWPLTNTKE